MKRTKTRRRVWVAAGLAGLLLLAACSAAIPDNAVETPQLAAEPVPAVTEEAPIPSATSLSTAQGPAPEDTLPPAVEEVAGEPAEEILTEDNRPNRLRSATASWNTNWNKHIIDYSELLSGGPPRDGIPSIDDPKFVSPGEAAEWLADNEPVIALEIDGEARAYPLQILTWHEIVNDTVGGVPVIVTFCPLCNSALAFDRRVGDETFEFGTSGLLRYSDLVMYDRTSESLWQQLTGEAIIGDLAGERLDFVPSSLVGFADFRETYPEGIVLSQDTGFSRNYGRNPYAGYDRIGNSPFLFDGEDDDRLPAMERVVTIALSGLDVGYPLSVLSELGVINDTQGGRDLGVFHAPGTSSALGASTIAEAADVGATGVFDPYVDGQKLTFRLDGDQIIDEQTGSTWNVLGQAIDGPLAGDSLEPIVHGDHFWFAWAAFKPDTIIYQPE